MSKDVLYYPTIAFRQEDYRWLWVAALLWDRVYRIVPKGYEPNEPRNIRELCSTGEIGVALNPKPYSGEASQRFMDSLDGLGWQAAALEFEHENIEECNEYVRLHSDKVDVALKNLMLLEGHFDMDDEWLYVSKELSAHYMIYLASEIAKKNNLSLNTHDADAWTASNYFLHDGFVQDGLYLGQDYCESSAAAITPLFLNDVIPKNILDIPPQKLLEFRDKRKDERRRLWSALDDFSEKLSQASDPTVLHCIWEDERHELEAAAFDYKKSMDIINTRVFAGGVSALMEIGAGALSLTGIDPHVIFGLTAGGVGLGCITGILERRNPAESSPYSYINSIRKITPSNFTDIGELYYRKNEEFIND